MADNDWISQIGAIVAPLLEQLSPRSAEAKVMPRDQDSLDLMNAIEKDITLPENSRIGDPLSRGFFDPLKKEIFKQVLRSSQARPETVAVNYSNAPEMTGNRGIFNTQTNEIGLRSIPSYVTRGGERYSFPPIPTSIAEQETLTHELLHFLMKSIPPDLLKSNAASYPELNYDQSTRRKLRRDNPASLLPAMVRPTGPTVDDSTKAFETSEAQHQLIQYLLGSSIAPRTLAEHEQHKPLSTPLYTDTPIAMLYRALARQIFPNQPLQDQVLSGLKGR